MAFVSFYKSDHWDFKISISKINGEDFSNFLRTNKIDNEFVEEIQNNLSRKNLSFDNFNVRDKDGDLIEVWDNIELKITLKNFPLDTKHVLCYTNSKYSQRAVETGLHPSVFTGEKIEFNLTFYRNRWSGPINGNIQFFDNDKNLISVTKDFTFYSDERDTPPMGGGLFEIKDVDFTDDSDLKKDQINHWKTIVHNTENTDQLIMFDRDKKIRIYLNSSIKDLKKYLDNFKGLKGRKRGVFGLLNLAINSGPFISYVSEIMYPLGYIYEKALKKLEINTNPDNMIKDDKNKLYKEIKDIINIDKNKLNFTFQDMRVLAINLYSDIDKTEDKILKFAYQSSNPKQRTLIQGRAQLLLNKQLGSPSFINKNLFWEDENNER